MPGQKAVARAAVCICRGGIALTHLALVAGAGGVQQLGGSDVSPTPGEADRKHRKEGSSKHLSRCCPSHARPRGSAVPPGRELQRCRLRWAPGQWERSRGAGAVSAAEGGHRARRLLLILVKMRACSCRAGGPAAHDPGSMGLKLEGGRRAAHSSTLHHAGSTAPPGQSPPLPGSPASPSSRPRHLA